MGGAALQDLFAMRARVMTITDRMNLERLAGTPDLAP
jgi:hypothetical protein